MLDDYADILTVRFPRLLALDGKMLEAACEIPERPAHKTSAHDVADILAVRQKMEEAVDALRQNAESSLAEKLFPETVKGLPAKMPWAFVRALDVSAYGDKILVRLYGVDKEKSLFQSVLTMQAWEENKQQLDNAVFAMENEFAPPRGIKIITGSAPIL